MPSLQAAIEHRDVGCPFCGLLCDDLTVRADDGKLTPDDKACPKAQLAYRQSEPSSSTPLINGTSTTLALAIAHAAKLLKRSRRPLVAGLGTDVAGMRSALALAEACRGTVQHMHGTALGANLRVLQTRGWHTTTLGEVRNRADLVVLVGVDINVNFQNLVRRYLAPASALQAERRAARRLVYLGPKKSQPVAGAELACETIAVSNSLTDTVRHLQALIGGHRVSGADRGQALAGLATAIRNAQYPVFVWAPGQLDPAQADLTIAAVCDLVADLNRTQRAAGIALGGDDGGQSALAVCTWLTGFPLGVSFAGETLDYSPPARGVHALLASGQHDLLLWISSFSPTAPPPHDLPQIVLAPPGYPASADHTVYIPVGTPGLDHAGQLIRTDGVVALPLRQLREIGLPAAAVVLTELLAALG